MTAGLTFSRVGRSEKLDLAYRFASLSCALHPRDMKLKNIQHPVPSDIDIAQAASPLPITEIVKDVGLRESEVDCYGSYKAKVDAVESGFC